MMHKQKIILLLINMVFGSAVLLSYFWGFKKYPDSISKLWGNVPESIRSYYTLFMFVAAAGYFAFLYFILIKSNPNNVQIAYKYDYTLYYWIFLMILIPSAIWMPLTFQMIISPSLVIGIIIRIVLALVAIGSIVLIIAIFRTTPVASNTSHTVAVIGAVAFSIQTVLLDAIIWTIYFPIK